MPGTLAKTSVDNNHYHMVYASEQGFGVMSPAKDGHSHEISLTPPQVDEFGQQTSDAAWVVSEAAGHDHLLEQIIYRQKKTKSTDDEEAVRRVHALFKEADSLESEGVKSGEESWDFYLGHGQWPKSAKSLLKGENRAALTINELANKIDFLVGNQAQNRSDIHIKPNENGDERVADILTMLIKNIMDQTDYIYEESETFRDEVITGRGIFNVFIDFDKNIDGDVRVQHYPWSKVRFGPHERLDQSDMEYLVKFDNFSMAKLKSLFPEKAKEVTRFMADLTELDSQSIHERFPGRQYEFGEGKMAPMINGVSLVDVDRKDFVVFELWQKEYIKIPVAAIAEEDFVENVELLPKNELQMVRMIPGVTIMNRVRTQIRSTKVAGSILLETQVLDLPKNANDFHLVTSYAKKYKGRFQGKVEDIKDLQMEINKRHSQAMDAINKNASYGWFIGPDTFLDETDEDNFKQNSSRAGFVQRIADIARPPQKVEGIRFPSEIIGMEEISSRKLNEIMGIPPEVLGMGQQSSGRAMLIQRRQSLVSNDYLFDNLSRAKRKLGQILIAYIQEFYTPERIARIVTSPGAGQGVDTNTNVVQMSPDDVMTIMQDLEVSRYDVVVEESAHTKTMKDMSFLQLMELAHQGIPGLEQSIIESGPFINKSKILEQMGLQRQAAAQAEQSKNQTELLKSAPDQIKNAVYSQMFGMGQQGGDMMGMSGNQQPELTPSESASMENPR